MKSSDASPNSEQLVLPKPGQPLLERNADQFDPGYIIAAMETLLKTADLGPAFEAHRLASKSWERFRM
jgi:hypothetical protein